MPRRKIKHDFKIGDRVVVSKKWKKNAEYFRDKNRYVSGHCLTYEEIEVFQPFEAVVVGGRWLKPGKAVYLGEDGGTVFESQGEAVFALLVREGFINREIAVPVNGVRHYDGDWQLPYYYNEPNMSEQAKAILKEEVKNFPRDEKGRFTAYPPLIPNDSVERNAKGQLIPRVAPKKKSNEIWGKPMSFPASATYVDDKVMIK